MEESIHLGNKSSQSEQALQLLEILQAKHSAGSTTFYLRRSSYPNERRLQLDLEKLRYLENDGVLKVTENDYKRAGAIDPNVITVHLQPKGQQLLKSRVTTTTQTVTEMFQEAEPAWKVNKRYRNFVRTERGFGIVTSSPEGLASNIRGHISALQRGAMTRSEWKSRQIWLMYALLYRYDEIPEQLRHEAEDYRDLAWRSKRRKPST